MDEIDRLEADLSSARTAVREHLLSAVAVGYVGEIPIGSAETPVDQAWLDRYSRLKAAAAAALTAANRAWDRNVRR
jgi:NAD/NADP transhydrogenase beta subunit